MGMFSNSKKKPASDFRILSEEEIQKKLYGDFRPPLVGQMSASAKQERNDFKNPSLESLQEELNREDELFMAQAKSETISITKSDSSVIIEDKQKRLEIKKEVLTVAPAKKASDEQIRKKLSENKQKKRLDVAVYLKKFAVFFIQSLQSIGFILGKAGQLLWVALRSLGELIYVNRKAAKNIVFWAVSIAIIGALFFSVHFLNINREKAMKASAPAKRIADLADSSTSAVSSSRQVSTPSPVKSPVQKVSSETSETSEGPLSKPQADTTTATTASSESQVETAGTSETGQGRYVVQVATYLVRQDADRLTSQLKGGGFLSFVREVTRTSGRNYYMVYLGRFATYRQAQETFSLFKQKEVSRSFQDAFIRTLSA